MKIIRGSDIEFVPISHEDPKDPGVYKKVLFKKEELTAGRIQMVNWARLLPGKTMREHRHQGMDEFFVIISGIATFNQVSLEKGDAVLVSRGEAHTMKAGKEDVYYLVVGIV